mmetsp:Transcript_49125/g.130062  ORF Transcript_49125/g.130062 Transcript_49125/m.130062 type:complete len:203 (-) Transcript_49125:480-1088(-)
MKTTATEPSASQRAQTEVDTVGTITSYTRTRLPWTASSSWFTAMTSAFVYVSTSKAFMSTMFEPRRRGAMSTAHRLNCVLLRTWPRYLVEAELVPKSISGSLKAPGPPWAVRPMSMRAAIWQVCHSVTSAEIRHEFPRTPPPRASVPKNVMSSQGRLPPPPHTEKKIGRPVAFRESRMRPNCAKATSLSSAPPWALQLSSLR